MDKFIQFSKSLIQTKHAAYAVDSFCKAIYKYRNMHAFPDSLQLGHTRTVATSIPF